MTSGRNAARWLLVLAALALAAPLVADEECDEPCGIHCGDCAACPLTAELGGTDGPVGLTATNLWMGSDPEVPAQLARGVDHVPLS